MTAYLSERVPDLAYQSIAKIKIPRDARMPGPSVNRVHQSADDAVRIINNARKHGQSLEVTKEGIITVKRSMPNFLVLWVRKLLASDVRSAEDDERTLKSVLATKMKIDLVNASNHTSEQLRSSLDRINKVGNEGGLNKLCDEWIAIKNTVQLHDSHMSDALLFAAAQKRPSQPRGETANTIENRVSHSASASMASAAGLPLPQPAHPMQGHESPATAKQGDVREVADILNDDPHHAHSLVAANGPEPLSELHFQLLINEVNQSLPSAMPEISRPGETVKCTLTVPESEQLMIFSPWRTWETHAKPPSSSAHDPFVGLSEQFSKDADRMTYVFESDGFPVECERDRESVAIAFKQAAGKNPMRQLILSHLLDQGIVLEMLKLLLNAHPTRDGRACLLSGPGGKSETTRQVFHTTAHDNGDVDIEYLVMKKCTQLAGADSRLIDINASSAFDGPVSPNNAGTVQSMKIRLLNADLNRGQLSPRILKPLQLSLQVELPVEELGE